MLSQYDEDRVRDILRQENSGCGPWLLFLLIVLLHFGSRLADLFLQLAHFLHWDSSF